MRILLIPLILLALVSVASAEFTIEEYEQYRAKDAEYKESGQTNPMDVYLTGYVKGIEWSNSVTQQSFEKSFVCPPKNVPLNIETYKKILDKQISLYKELLDNAEKSGKPEEIKRIKSANLIEVQMVYGMMNAFPCK